MIIEWLPLAVVCFFLLVVLFERRTRVRFFPELALFESIEQRRTAWHRAGLAAAGRATLWFPALALLVLDCLIIFALPALGVPIGRRGTIRGICFVSVCIFIFGLGWWSHRTMQRSLREQLVECGIAICLSCGYDLRGSTDRCPECGTPFTMSS